VPSTVTSLYDLAQDVLSVAEVCLGTTTLGVPDLAYVAPASPVFDCCPALIVSVAALTEESTSPLGNTIDTGQRTRFGRVNLASFNVTALRCDAQMKTDGSVTIDEVEAAARAVLEDGWALWCGFYAAISNGTFEGKCSDVHFDAGRAVSEQGGCVGWSFLFRCQIDGIPVTDPST
jgi:hypothetical protein